MVPLAALVLDDDVALRRSLKQSLATEGWQVRCAPRSSMAMQLLVLRRPDLVLLDVSPPNGAPEALAAGLHIHYGNLPILAIGDAPNPGLTRRIGAFEFL